MFPDPVALPVRTGIGLALVALALVGALLAARYFFARRGAAAALGFATLFWGGIAGAWLLAGGRVGLAEKLEPAAAWLLTVLYVGYLAAFRGRLRGRYPGAPEAERPALRRCPGCGLAVDAGRERCPVCGSPGGRPGSGGPGQ